MIEAPRQICVDRHDERRDISEDQTGARRFLPMRCGEIKLKQIERCRDQLWAEAVQLYEQKCSWWIDGDTLGAAAEAQADRYLADVWEDKIAAYATGARDVSVAEVLETCLGIMPGRWSRGEQMRVARCLTHLKFVCYQSRKDGAREWRYRLSPTVTNG